MRNKTVLLLVDYGGFKKGQCVDVTERDAASLIDDGIACATGGPVQLSESTETDQSKLVEQIYEQIESEMKGGVSVGKKLFYAGAKDYGTDGWSAISNEKFFMSGGVDNTPFDNCGQFLKAIKGSKEGAWDERLKVHTKDLAEGVQSTGGFLIPTGMANFMWTEVLETNPFLVQAVNVPMDSNKIQVPFVMDTDRSTSGIHGVGSAKGGPPHVAEAGALADISPTFGACELTLHKIGGRCRVSNEMLEDSAMALSSLLPNLFADALAWRIMFEMIAGSGAGEMMGVLNAPATVSQAKQTGQVADTIVSQNIMKMFSRMQPSSHRTAFWLCNLDCLPQLLSMTVQVGTAGSVVWLVGNRDSQGLANSPPLTILGRPVYFTEFCSTVGTVGDIVFVNPKAYAVGRKPGAGIRIDVSEHARFENDQTVFRPLTRIDGQPLQSEPITPHSGSANTLSNFVTLASRD